MNITKTELACIGIFILLCVVSIYFYPQMPQQMACHWNSHGQVDGYMSKSVNMLICPVILAASILTLIIIPRIVSVSVNIEGFRKFYGGFVLLFSIFLLLVQYQMILWNIGIEINPLWVILVSAFIVIDCAIILIYREHKKKH
jgi:uncharacterized membrane protein